MKIKKNYEQYRIEIKENSEKIWVNWTKCIPFLAPAHRKGARTNPSMPSKPGSGSAHAPEGSDDGVHAA